MAVALEKFVKQLEDSGIVAPGKLENFVPPKAHPKDAEELARQLVKADHLTPFQAQHVLLGKTKALILGNYTILDKIGAGGMGQVFKAEHRRMERIVAIKMLPPAMTKDAAAAARFQREVKAAARLRHPNIVAADDADEANGAHFLVMEYVEGRDLSAHVKKNGPFSVAKALDDIRQAACGLAFAHAEGVIHRDIKPANLLLDKKGVVKILDMGLARIDASGGDVPAQAELTGTGAIMGTVDYMAPEQGVSTKDADARADIYSLGCTLHYLLIGRPVYGGESVGAKFLAHHHQPIPDLCALREDVPQQVNVIFRKMVAKKVEDRYQTMTEVVADLQACGAGHDQSLTMQRSISLNTDNSALTFLKNIPAATTHKPKAAKKTSPDNGGDGKAKWIYGAVAAGFLFIALGVWIIIKNEKGEEVNRVEVPDKHSLELVSGKPGPTKVVAEPSPPKSLVAPFDAARAKAHQVAWAKHLDTTVESKNPIGMTLVLIPPGEFLMGSTLEQSALGRKIAEDSELPPTDGAVARLKEEGPQHRVMLTKPYWLGMTEVTTGEFKKFVEATKYVTQAEQFGFGNSGATKLDDKITPEQKKITWQAPGYAVSDDSPVTQVTWNDAVQFCNWLSEQEELKPCYRQDAKDGWILLPTGMGYRLPTEAEWEYACRAGTTTQFSFGDDPAMLDIYGWFNKNAGGSARAVGLKVANAFDLLDMHGNAQEWCQDFYAGDYYSKSSPADPFGPSSGSNRVLRGGLWSNVPVNCRSASRYYGAPVLRNNNNGFRVVRVSAKAAPPVVVATITTSQPATPVKSGGGQSNQPWNTPAFQQWTKDVQATPADKQVEAVRKKLMELNPRFDGKLAGKDGRGTPKIENNVVTEFAFLSDNVTDVSPVRALAGLKVLNCGGSSVGKGKLSDLSSLYGMRLTELDCHKTRVSELSPLRGMRLTFLDLGNDGFVSDLSPLEGMPLKTLSISETSVSDLSPLRGMSLSYFLFTPKNITKGLDVIRQMGSLTTIGTGGYDKWSPIEFWKKYDAGEFGTPAAPANRLADINNSPAFQQWVKATQALPAEKQIEAVSKKLMELNPGFDGKVTGWEGKGTPRIDDGVVTKFGFVTDNVTEISPVQALVGLKVLRCAGSGWGITQTGKLSDITPLRGLQLMALDCGHNQLTNLSPLEGMKLTELRCGDTKVSDLLPLQGMPLTNLTIHATRVSDLSPLNGMPLTTLQVGAKVFDLSPLANCTSLKTLNARETKASPASIAALQKALPNCKIEWDGAAKPITNVNDPAFQQWIRTVAAMPAEKQVEAVAKKLQELNPGFDGKVTGAEGRGTPKIENGVVTEFGFITDNVTDISPVQALVGLKALNCSGNYRRNGKLSDLSPLRGMKLNLLTCTATQVRDLSPLEGMPLTRFFCGFTQVSDLSSLHGMSLTALECFSTEVSELSPLQGMPLKELNCGNTRISDLSSLQGMPLTGLIINDTFVSDVSPLQGMHLGMVSLSPTKIVKGLDIVRQMKSLKAIGLRGDKTKLPPAEFWKKFDAGEFGRPISEINEPAFQQWMKTVATLPAGKQIEAVSKKLMELNPGFEGKLTYYGGKGPPKIENGVVTEIGFVTDNVTDISPLRALVGLKSLSCRGSDAGKGKVSDLSPLRGMPLASLNCSRMDLSDLWPLEGMPLKFLDCGLTQVSDLSPLKGMPLTNLWCNGTHVSDLSPLEKCGSLKSLNVINTKVTAASVAALQKVLPNCKIEWDDPAKPKRLSLALPVASSQ